MNTNAVKKSKSGVWLDGLAGALVLAAALLVFLYAPLEATMGAVQKVFYFHVAAGWSGMLGFLVAAVGGILYLVKRETRWDDLSLAGVELGMMFALINIVSGMIWAQPVWNTWWTWDPRLTTAAIMEMVYAAYLLLRSGMDDPERRARFGAVYAIVGFISVPFTFFSIRIFRTIHPVIIGGDPAAGSMNMTPRMVFVFVACLVAFSALFADLLRHRVRLSKLSREVQAMRDNREGE